MINNERHKARRYDTPNRCHTFTEKVYSGPCENKEQLVKEVFSIERTLYYPKAPEYSLYFGEMHGHTNLSDGIPDIDDYFKNIRDNAKLDFAALTDHDHGGIGNPELYGDKWEMIKSKVKEYNNPGKFSVLLAYERDSYPWYNNMVVYYKNSDGDMFIDKTNGEISYDRLLNMLQRDDILVVPHDTYNLEAGADFNIMPPELFTPLLEILSRGDSAEYFDNPYNTRDAQCEGGFWQDALKRGAKMGCIAGSDDHQLQNGLYSDGGKNQRYEGISKFPGITGVWAESNTPEAIFDALKKRRCYGFMGGRIFIDFRINGHYMGEEFDFTGDREIYFNIRADSKIKRVTIVKNCRDYIIFRRNEQFLYDYKVENEIDFYYLRVELEDNCCGWTSPIWIHSK